MGTDHIHRLCTYKEAEEAIRAHEVVYVNDCFCRGPARAGETKWEYCGCPVEVCMGFKKPEDDAKFASKEISTDQALEIFEDWKKRGNFFRFLDDEEWICCCCKCGCGWMRDEDGNRVTDTCNKSHHMEKTHSEKCDLCGICVELCPYKARSISDGEMIVNSADCYGCSACEFACPQEAISMVPRN